MLISFFFYYQRLLLIEAFALVILLEGAELLPCVKFQTGQCLIIKFPLKISHILSS